MTMRSKLGASGRASPRVPPTALTPGNLCDDNPENIASSASPGVSEQVSRCDHVHALGADIVTGDNIDPIDSTTNEGGPRITFIIPWVGPGAGAGDATLFNANIPFKFRYISAICLTTNIGAGTGAGTIRTAAGGLGGQVSTAMGTTTTATRTVDASGGIVLGNHTFAAGSSMFFRLTDGTAQGVLYVDVVRID